MDSEAITEEFEAIKLYEDRQEVDWWKVSKLLVFLTAFVLLVIFIIQESRSVSVFFGLLGAGLASLGLLGGWLFRPDEMRREWQ